MICLVFLKIIVYIHSFLPRVLPLHISNVCVIGVKLIDFSARTGGYRVISLRTSVGPSANSELSSIPLDMLFSFS